MNRKRVGFYSSLPFFVAGFLIMLDQYLRIGVWFQLTDIHHETFILVSFALAIGIIIGSLSPGNQKCDT